MAIANVEPVKRRLKARQQLVARPGGTAIGALG